MFCVARYYTGDIWLYGVRGAHEQPHTLFCHKEDSLIQLMRVPAQNARFFYDLNHEVEEWCKAWLNSHSVIGCAQLITDEARIFLTQALEGV